jgi:bacterioferritin
MLNAALSEEWLAILSVQYWIGARLMEGPIRNKLESSCKPRIRACFIGG